MNLKRIFAKCRGLTKFESLDWFVGLVFFVVRSRAYFTSLFLSSENRITGEVININGGLNM